MIGVLKKILGSGDTVSKGMDLIDDLWETDAEKRESKTQAKIQLMNAYAPFKIAQRYIALLFTGVFLACFVICLGFVLPGHGNTEDIIMVMDQFNIQWAMMTILLFYFGGGMVESIGRSQGKNQ